MSTESLCKMLIWRTIKMIREKCRLLSCVALVICLLMCLAAGVSEEGKLSLPAELSVIESGAFMNDTDITDVEIPEGTIIIGDHAFSGCTSLTTIHIPQSVDCIDASAFDGCTGLLEVVIENNLTSIGEDAFANCADDLIIYGYTDESLAREYALANGITFVPIWSWSEWTTSIPEEGTESQSKTQYRCRTVGTQTVYSDWGAWQSNGSTPISKTDLRDVRTVEHAAVTKTIYHYNRYRYKNASGTTYFSYADGYANANGFSGSWEYYNSETRLAKYKVYDGSHQAYGNSSSFWFNETTTTQTVSAAYTEYQYCTRTVSEETVYGSWSVWGDDAILPADNIEIEDRTVYRTFGKTSEQSQMGKPVSVPEGMYVIRAASGNVVDADQSRNAEHTALSLCGESGGNNQKYVLSRQADDWYLIQVYDGLAVSIDGGQAQLLSVTGGSNQYWRFLYAGRDCYYIENGNSGYLAGASDGSITLAPGLEEADKWTISATSLAAPVLDNDSTTNFTVGSITQTGAAFTWTDLIGVDTYNIHIAKDGNEIHTATGVISGYSCSSLSPNTTYTAWLEAVNSAGSGISTVKTFTTKSNLPVIEFKQTSITVNENLAFSIGVKVTNYNNASLAVSMTTTDPKLDIVETKFTGPNQTLKTLYQKGIIKDLGYSNSADLQNSSARTFYLNSASGTLHIGGNYIRSANTVTLTIKDSPNGSYTVGANRTCVITYNDVDGKKPSKSSYSSKAAYVSACGEWLKVKFPSGKYWNHPVGTICDDDNITSVSCTTHTHGSNNDIYSTSCFDRGVVPGDSICMRFAHYGSAQCMGFALKVGKDIFGSSATDTSKWTNLGKTASLEAGDYVRIDGHSMFVISVSGSSISTLECNRGANCIIHRNTRYVNSSAKTIDGVAIIEVRRIKSWK